MIKNVQKYFLIALMLHMLLFISFSSVLFPNDFDLEKIYKPRSEKELDTIMPSYVLPESINTPPKPKAEEKTPKPVLTSPKGIEKKQEPRKQTKTLPAQPSKQTQSDKFSTRSQIAKDKSDDIPQPLLDILHQATGENLVYPKIAADFNEMGMVGVGYTISPNGQISQVKLIKTSGYDILDQAALDAIHAMSPVKNVSAYLDKPKYIAAYIEFRLR